MTVKCFEDLEIWQEARELCKIVRNFSSRYPFCNDYGLKSQINNSSGSVMDNIAEGFERDGNKEFSQFLSVSKGSCGETRSQSYRAFDANFINDEELANLLSRTEILGKKIGNFMVYLKRAEISGRKFKQYNPETSITRNPKQFKPET